MSNFQNNQDNHDFKFGLHLIGSFLVVGLLLSNAYAQSVTGNELEKLLQTRVYGASKFEQNLEDSPSSVTVVSENDIKTYGHETLADVMNTFKGVNTSYDRAYRYTGIRGFSKPGDYNTRMLILSDGFRLNEPLYDSALVGNDSIIDLDWTKSIEYVSGAASSLYGSNALLGILDIKTLSGSDLDGIRLKTQLGSYGKKKATYLQGGKLDEYGNDWIIGVTTYDRTGESLHLSNKLDGEQYSKGFAKININNLQVNFGFSTRTKDIPTGQYGTTLNEPGTVYKDDSYYLNTIYTNVLSTNLESISKIRIAEFKYDGYLNYSTSILKDSGHSQWIDIDQGFIYNGISKHQIAFGINYQTNLKLRQWTSDLVLDDRTKSKRESIYFQDDWRLTDKFILNYGLRYDTISYNNIDKSFTSTSPRVGLTYIASPSTRVKIIRSNAFRAPNTYELRYDYLPGNISNHHLNSEKIINHELIIEHTLNPTLLLTTNIYENKFKNLISPQEISGGSQFQNIGSLKARGIEFEMQWLPGFDKKLRANIALQDVNSPNETAINSPRTLAKVIGDAPIPGTNLIGAIQFFSSSKVNSKNGELPGYQVSHLTISEKLKANRGRLSFKVENLFDKKFSQPAEATINGGTLAQDGRTYLLIWEYQP